MSITSRFRCEWASLLASPLNNFGEFTFILATFAFLLRF
jgi:predicted Kef-type K+ transport protein